MTTPARLRVAAAVHGYDIVIGHGAIDDARSWDGIGGDIAALIVTDRNVRPLHAPRLQAVLAPRFSAVDILELEPGEAHKTWPSVERIVDRLLDLRAGRGAVLVALGGGVVGDVAGFAAASYMRGIACIQVPTTLLAQVDSSVGGKTGINHPRGKNMIGAFHAPVRVVADTATLATLPQREFVAGLAEVIKYGAIADDAFLHWIDVHLQALLDRDAPAIGHAVRRSCEIKAAIVSADETETGLRMMLNFGHTFGHAIESGTGYRSWLHGEAVACGMVMAAEMSCRLGLLERGRVERLRDLIAGAGLPVRPPPLGVERWLDLMRSDKKSEGGSIRLILLDGAGTARVDTVEPEPIRDVLHAFGV